MKTAIDPEAWRERLGAARTRLEAGLREGRGGAELLKGFSREIEGVVVELVQRASQSSGASLRNTALVAVGGLGREELGPHSDVDLVAVPDRGADPETTRFDDFVRALVHPLWDLGIRANVTVHSPESWLSRAGSDLPLCTALLDARVLAGDPVVLERLRHEAWERFFAERRLAFLERLAEEVSERHARYGGTVYMVEPDLKFGPGGVRDAAVVRWCLLATHESGDLVELTERGVLRQGICELLLQARDVLFRFRAALQLAAGRGQDRLVFQYQESLPPYLGLLPLDAEVDDARLVRTIESAMQDYYRAARDILRYGRRICERCRPASTPDAAMPRRIDERFGVVDGRLVHDGSTSFRETPVLALEALLLAATKGLRLSGETFDAMAEAATSPAAGGLRDEPEAQRRFLELLCEPEDVGMPSALELCSELRLLEQIVPEWGPIRGRMQHDPYHVYTVDQHTLSAVAMLKRLARGEYNKDYPLATALHLEIDDPRVLYLATLVHDAGKAEDGDQCETGAVIAHRVATRAGFAEEEVERCALLVREHLTMPLLSQKRDLSDPLLIADFAGRVSDRATLKELYLLSLVDMASVRPGNLTSWKLTLLDELYLQACAHLRRGTMKSRRRLRRGREPLDLPERYYSLYHFDLRRHHAELIESLVEEGRGALVEVASGSGALRLTLVARDRPGLLAQTAAILDDYGLEVMAADVFSAPGPPPVAVDVFRVLSKEGPEQGLDPATLTEIEQALQVGMDREALASPPAPRRRPAWRRHPKVPTRVEFDVDPSGTRTIVEVQTEADSGVLRRITLAFAAEGIEIEVARCNTEADRVFNVFYVPLLDDAGRESLEERLSRYLD